MGNYKFGDLTRGAVKAIVPDTFYEPDDLAIRIEYTPYRIEGKAEIAERLTNRLLELGTVSADRADNGHYTWFKLSEWMQVEIIASLGEYLEHTPWYRFPFMETLGLYFQILGKETSIVHRKMGVDKALLSSAFLTDLIPGVVMTLLLGQLSALAQPVLLAGGTEYDQSKLVEELVLVGPASVKQLGKVHPGVSNVRELGPSLYSLTAPTFKTLTEVLSLISSTHPDLVLVSISNQVEVQVRVAVETKKLKKFDWIIKQNGCELQFHYSLPSAPNLTYAAVGVKTPFLLEFFRWCKKKNLNLVQVYDFYA